MKTPKLPIVSLCEPDDKGYRVVRIRVSFNGREDLYPNVSVKDEQWDAEKQRVKHGCNVRAVRYSLLNKRITDCLDFIQDYCDKAQLREDEKACALELKEQYNAKFKRTDSQKSDEFFFLLEDYYEKHNRDNNWSPKYYEQWKIFCKDLKAYKPKLKFSDLSDTMLMSYVRHLSERMSNEKIKEYLKKLKEFIKYAKKKNMPINPEFYDFRPKLSRRDKQVSFLNPDEVRRIISLNYDKTPSLDRVRDIFIFQCCTSLRYSDVRALTKDKIRLNKDGYYEVNLVTKKDKGFVWFELNSIATRIYNKYKDCNYKDNTVFHVCCDTDFRKFLHRIGSDAKIEGEVTTITYKLDKQTITTKRRQDISTHDARRTFIVTAINGGATTDMISLYTSHSEVEQMLPYLAISEAGKRNVNRITQDAFTPKDSPKWQELY